MRLYDAPPPTMTQPTIDALLDSYPWVAGFKKNRPGTLMAKMNSCAGAADGAGAAAAGFEAVAGAAAGRACVR